MVNTHVTPSFYISFTGAVVVSLTLLVDTTPRIFFSFVALAKPVGLQRLGLSPQGATHIIRKQDRELHSVSLFHCCGLVRLKIPYHVFTYGLCVYHGRAQHALAICSLRR